MRDRSANDCSSSARARAASRSIVANCASAWPIRFFNADESPSSFNTRCRAASNVRSCSVNFACACCRSAAFDVQQFTRFRQMRLQRSEASQFVARVRLRVHFAGCAMFSASCAPAARRVSICWICLVWYSTLPRARSASSCRSARRLARRRQILLDRIRGLEHAGLLLFLLFDRALSSLQTRLTPDPLSIASLAVSRSSIRKRAVNKSRRYAVPSAFSSL